METLEYIGEKYQLDMTQRYVEIPNMGRDNLPALFHELGFKVGVEIGIEEGVYSEIICKGMPGVSLHCVDPWTAYTGYRDHVSQEKLDRFYETAKARLALHTNAQAVRAFSMDAVKQFEDESLDFVYVDGNHEIPWVIDDICAWRKKVRSGGIISGHDYYESKRLHTKCHVKYAVNCAAAAFRVRPLIIIGLRSKADPEFIRDNSRSWMWVKR